jgi:hypothetical protein
MSVRRTDRWAHGLRDLLEGSRPFGHILRDGDDAVEAAGGEQADKAGTSADHGYLAAEFAAAADPADESSEPGRVDESDIGEVDEQLW